jgi:UrcA family protein
MDQSQNGPPVSRAGAVAILLGCVFAASSAFAGEPEGQVRTEDIMFQDLNLNTSAGVDALYQRVHSAAQHVCAVSAGQADLGAASASARCSKEAEARAIEKMNLPALTALAANR